MSYTVRKTLLLDSRQATSYRNNNHHVCTFSLLEPLNKLKRLRLSSLEYPNFIPNVREGINVFNITVSDTSGNSSVVSYTLTTENYDTIDNILAELNAQLVATSVSGIQSMTAVASGNFIIFKYVLSSATNGKSVRPTADTTFAQEVLGFTAFNDYKVEQVNSTQWWITSRVPYNLCPDTYMQMDIPNVPQHPVMSSGSSKPIRIPLMCDYGQTMLLSASNGLSGQWIDVHSKDTRLNQLQIMFYDRFSNLLTTVKSGSWSATLELEFYDGASSDC